jgi:hypothetical protein
MHRPTSRQRVADQHREATQGNASELVQVFRSRSVDPHIGDFGFQLLHGRPRVSRSSMGLFLGEPQ